MDLRENTIQLISDTVNQHLQNYNVAPCNIAVFETSEGEEAIRVGVCYYVGEEVVIDPKVTMELLTDLNRKLLEVGEERFPYIRHYLGDDQKVRGDWNVCGANRDRQEANL